MAELAYRKLNDDEVAAALLECPGWTREGDEIVRSFAFDSYMEGVQFAVRIATIADELDHHPDMLIGYRKVTVRISTHSVGGLSPYDFELARRIDR